MSSVDLPGGYPQLIQPEPDLTQDTNLPPDNSIKKTMNSVQFNQPTEEKKENTFEPTHPQTSEENKENTCEPTHQQTSEGREKQQETAEGGIDRAHTVKPHSFHEISEEEAKRKSLISQEQRKEILQVPHREEERYAEQPQPPPPPQQPQEQPPQQPPQQATNINEPTSPDVAHPRGIEQKSTEGTKLGGQKFSKTKDKINATFGSIKDKFTKLVKTDKPKEKKSERNLSEERIKSGEIRQDPETQFS